jgi:hypothetical protein
MTSSSLPRWLILLSLAACAPARQETASPVSAASKGSNASAVCGSAPASTATSKVRHIPDENDPCADSRGLPPR